MEPDAEFSGLLDDHGPEASTATLRTIVHRHRERQQRRLRITTALSVVVALAAVGVAGSGLGRGRSAPAGAARSHVPASASTTGDSKITNPATAKGPRSRSFATAAPSAGVAAPGTTAGLSRLFVSRDGTVTVRAYQQPESAVALSPSTGGVACGDTTSLVVEVADPGAVGTITVRAGVVATTPPGTLASVDFDTVDSAVIGTAERDPVQVVTVHVAAGTATVLATFADGSTDRADTVDGWAVLVDRPAKASTLAVGSEAVTLTAVAGDGTVRGVTALPPGAGRALAAPRCGPGTGRLGTAGSAVPASSAAHP
jgi:hypothetical protein